MTDEDRHLDTGRHGVCLRRRPVDETVRQSLENSGYHPCAARVLAARCGADAPALAAPGVASLTPPDGLPDIAPAVERLAAAVTGGEIIGIVTDHDVDGVTSHAVLIEALTRWCRVPESGIRSYIGHRLKEGYGLSAPVADRVLQDDPRPRVIITADCGSSDEPRIQRLRNAGIDVIVTDHHAMGRVPDAAGTMRETPPPSALAVVNPSRADSAYGDPMICGCMVTWLTLCALRTRLLEMEWLAPETPSLAGLLDFVALGTVADCVSLGLSGNNRAVVRRGLKLIQRGERACWRAARAFIGGGQDIGAQDLAFGIGPRINARGRLSEAMAGVHFLLAATDAQARGWAQQLEAENSERKAIERGLTEVALEKAEMAARRGDKGFAIWLEDGHPGVHGIVASRVLERYARPVVCLSPHARDAGQVTGSARSPDGVHLLDIMERMHCEQPDLMERFGGHAAAAGLSLPRAHLESFQAAFVRATEFLDASRLHPVVHSDGVLEPGAIDDGLMAALAGLEPYGKGFGPALFEAPFRVSRARLVGATPVHAQLSLSAGRHVFKAIWFFAAAEGGELPVRSEDEVVLVFTPQYNEWNGNTEIQLVVKGVVRPGTAG